MVQQSEEQDEDLGLQKATAVSHSTKLAKEFKQRLSHLENSTFGMWQRMQMSVTKSVKLKGQLNVFSLKTVFYIEVEMTQK